MIFLALLFTIADIVVGELCNIYEVRNTDPKMVSPKVFGIYKINYRNICNGQPTYKIANGESYIYAYEHRWMIGLLQNDKKCDFVPYAYNSATSLQQGPKVIGWKYWGAYSKFVSSQIVVTCACGIVQLISDQIISDLNKTEIFGSYKLNNQERCNNHSIYRHLNKNFSIHVNSHNKWIISNIDGKDSSNMCFNKGVALNSAIYMKSVPSKSGWQALETTDNQWQSDTSVNAICTCNAFKIDIAFSTRIAGKNNLTGIYEIYSKKHQCHKRPIFKHSRQDYFMYVDSDDTWIIGGPKELATCMNSGYAYSVISPAPDSPSPTSWKYFNYIRDTWCTDEEMTITCL